MKGLIKNISRKTIHKIINTKDFLKLMNVQ
jgi:hypothetical protein